MGYTHYHPVRAKLPARAFVRAAEDCRKVCEVIQTRHDIRLAAEYDRPNDPPVFSAQEIRLNGVGELGHETFLVERVHSSPRPDKDYGGRTFEFCKTNRKPYDLAVTACLIVLKHHLGKGLVIGSDGGAEDWEAAARLVHELFGADYLEGFNHKETSESE